MMSDKEINKYLGRKCCFKQDRTKFFGVCDCVFEHEYKVLVHLINYPDSYVEVPVDKVCLVA